VSVPDITPDKTPAGYSAELRDFAEVAARALLMIVAYLNRRYRLGMRIRELD
jgi:hypothetical protein